MLCFWVNSRGHHLTRHSLRNYDRGGCSVNSYRYRRCWLTGCAPKEISRALRKAYRTVWKSALVLLVGDYRRGRPARRPAYADSVSEVSQSAFWLCGNDLSLVGSRCRIWEICTWSRWQRRILICPPET